MAGVTMAGVRSYLPRGNLLDPETFRRRHLLLCWVLGLHIPALFAFGVWQGFGVPEAALEMATPAICLLAARTVENRRLAAFFVTAGLVFCSSVLVHFSGGMIEAHFHFFVLIGLIALYQDWVPFLWNVVFTVLSHGLGSALAADSMFNHHAGQSHPWTWALIHGIAVLAACIGVLVFWKNTEIEQQKARTLAIELSASEVASAQAEATRRRSVSELLVNLARRNQSLLDRQLALIADLEQRQRDPEPLFELFQLDHLATRIRRNAESLLVLSGDEPPRLWGQPMPLAEVVRAAAAEIEHYRRVDIEVNDYLDVAGQIVADLAHLLAELIENATTFSPPDSRVRVRTHVIPSEWSTMAVSVEDTGMGMPGADMIAANEILAYSPEVDLRSSTLGFHVVSRLARRYGMQVRLAHTPGGGVTAMVALPNQLVSERTLPARAPSPPPAALEPAAATLMPPPPPELPTPAPLPDPSPIATPAYVAPITATPAVPWDAPAPPLDPVPQPRAELVDGELASAHPFPAPPLLPEPGDAVEAVEAAADIVADEPGHNGDAGEVGVPNAAAALLEAAAGVVTVEADDVGIEPDPTVATARPLADPAERLLIPDLLHRSASDDIGEAAEPVEVDADADAETDEEAPAEPIEPAALKAETEDEPDTTLADEDAEERVWPALLDARPQDEPVAAAELEHDSDDQEEADEPAPVAVAELDDDSDGDGDGEQDADEPAPVAPAWAALRSELGDDDSDEGRARTLELPKVPVAPPTRPARVAPPFVAPVSKRAVRDTGEHSPAEPAELGGWPAPQSPPLSTTPPPPPPPPPPTVPGNGGLARRVPGASLAPALRRNAESSGGNGPGSGTGRASGPGGRSAFGDRERVRSMLSQFQSGQTAGRATSVPPESEDE